MTFFCFVVTLTWNGNAITGPELIYQNELGSVVCRSDNSSQVGWHFANGALVPPTGLTDPHFQQIRTSSSATPSVSSLINNRPDQASISAAANGLWTCRLNGGFSTAVPVGIYARGRGGKYFCMVLQ